MAEEKSFKQRVVEAQNELKAPKGQMNGYGGYKYRSAEDILQAVKPINLKYGLLLNEDYDIIQVGERVYVKALATLTDIHSDEQISVKAFAREAQMRKGMDEAQVTGSSTSYARKYALNGLYLIDETESDYDSQDNRNNVNEQDFSDARGLLMNRIQSVANAKGGNPDKTYSYILKQLNSNEITPQNINKANEILKQVEQMEG